jgi:hypothetical protein
LPPIGAQYADLLRRAEGIIQQAEGVQLQQPLAFLHVGLPSGQILGMPCSHQKHL